MISSVKADKETYHISGKSTKLTVPEDVIVRVEAKASQPIIRAISWTKTFASRGVASFERSWESLARMQGWVETWTMDGKEYGGELADML